MKRCTRIVVGDVSAFLLAVGELKPATLVLDVEPLVLPWDSPPTLLASAAADFAQAMRAAVPSVGGLIYASNSRRLRPTSGQYRFRLIGAARKPWRTSYLRDAPKPIVVTGDQVLTDGLLAWRLDSLFLHWQFTGTAPWWPRLQRWLGQGALPILFRTEDGCAA